MSDMFIYERPLFDRKKIAGIEVDENPQLWARQVLSELYKQVPEVSDYVPNVMFLKVDEEQGYALGCVVLSSATDSALAVTRMGTSGHKALVPIIIKGHELQPLDLIMTKAGKLFPLTPARLREALFRPETFDMVTEEYGDSSLWNMFYPPGRSDNTFGAGISQGADGGTAGAVTMIQGPGMKLSGARFELLQDVVGPSALQPHYEQLKEALSDENVLQHATKNAASCAALKLLADLEKRAVKDSTVLHKVASELTSKPTVLQFGYDEGTDLYWIKKASRDRYIPRDKVAMSRGVFRKLAGDAVTQKVDTDGSVTVTPDPAVKTKDDPTASRWAPITESGIYKVKTPAGKEMVGWVLPELMDIDGVMMPMAVFTNGAAGSIQDRIVGARVAMGVDLPAGPAKGTGLFYAAGPGGIRATVPLTVLGGEAGTDGGDYFHVRTIDGEESRVCVVPGIVSIMALGKEFHIPPGAKFLPLNTAETVPLIDDVAGLSKTAANVLERSVTIHDVGGEYQVRFTNLPKLASAFDDQYLSHDDAAFMLGLAGLSARDAEAKLLASVDGVKVAGLLDITPIDDLYREARARVTEKVAHIAKLRQSLVKEAAVLPDVMTVDAVLSLNFVNSENVRLFVERLPYLDRALSMVCELLLGARLGLTEIPEAATARAARGLDASIQGLRALSLRKMEEKD